MEIHLLGLTAEGGRVPRAWHASCAAWSCHSSSQAHPEPVATWLLVGGACLAVMGACWFLVGGLVDHENAGQIFVCTGAVLHTYHTWSCFIVTHPPHPVRLVQGSSWRQKPSSVETFSDWPTHPQYLVGNTQDQLRHSSLWRGETRRHMDWSVQGSSP